MMAGLSSGRLLYFLLRSVLAGHVSGLWDSQTGPCHQSCESTRSLGPTPPEARSAGLVSVGTCLQC